MVWGFLIPHKLDISVFVFGSWLAITHEYTRVMMCNFKTNKQMETQKIYLAGNSGNGSTNDALLASMMNNGGFGGNGAWWLLFLLAFGRNGFFGNDGNLQAQLANDKANDWVIQALQGSKAAIDNIATTLNCDFNAVQSTLCQIAAQIQNVAAKTELTGAQIINAVQAGNSQVMNMIASCCCDLKGIMNQGFSSVGYALRDQTCEIEKTIAASTAQVLAGQKDAEMRELNREIATLREEKQDYKFGSMLAAYISPLKQEVAEIKCHLPKTVVIPANDDYVKVDRSINAPYCNNFAFGAYGNPYGPFPGGGFFG